MPCVCSGRTRWRFDDEGLEETVALEMVVPPGGPLISTIGDIGGFRHDDLASANNSRYFEPHGGTNRGLDFAELAPDVMVRTSDPTPTAGFRSTDGGDSFKAIGSVDDAGLVGFGKAAPGQSHPAVFVWGKVGGVEGVFRSDDVGKTWIKLHDDQWGFAELRALTGDPNRFGRVYLGVHGRGILYGDPSPSKN